ncbi:MAG: NADP-dependent malic enzyme [Bacteroidales bacterium]|nr:NADP-dependent malic enzyme [Bacteroidales bacterium]NCU35021.1 NADP-dependent malic enzyme [Candidatus Falkowbacteria bacterium]MDD2632344.1 NADP-dependent malic enzyme [Bacteroidales bacterium]MDD3130317.1 NADP-dependent malic enzyme [Bacteroidales bacterium]MDD4177542.1 NADP-dependent malic enzyme [Bacteroidales bacterium]
MDALFRKDALSYHAEGRPGKLEVIPTKPYSTKRDLSLAYSPGVADPCLKIADNPEDVYKYTGKGNLVAVISNGTAVLGLGDIGPLAGKPVMEGKGLLFKIFADIDVFDIEVNLKDPQKFIDTVVAIAPTFGGINLEDIKAPECFEIERKIQEAVDIPIMHDDQHGTAIITSAGLLNALKITKKKIEELKIVVNGAGASAISCSRLYLKLGARPENVIMLDSKGVLRRDRTDLNETKQEFVTDKDIHTLAEAIDGADVFLGLSKGGVLKKELLLKMAKDPIVFALANPDPEITYEDATSTRDDIIMATGRSDYPNQINNVLGFPFIFRGALDVRATCINDEMKLAASYALANLATEPVPDQVNVAYHAANFTFGREYIIPKPFDQRLITRLAPAVAKAAIASGVARKEITDWPAYNERLVKMIGISNPLLRQLRFRAMGDPKTVVFSEAESYQMLKAAEHVLNQKLATPILLGNETKIKDLIRQHELDLPGVVIIDPTSEKESGRREQFARLLFEKRQRKGVTMPTALGRMNNRNYFAPMLVETGFADAMVSGLTNNYPATIGPALEVIGTTKGASVVSGMYIVNTKEGPIFLSDCTVNKNPDAEKLVEITLQAASAVKHYNLVPRVALLTYSNFGSNRGRIPDMVADAVKILHRDHPELVVDGEIQANVALNPELLEENFPFSKLVGGAANVLIFPYLTAGNIAYKLLQQLGKFDVIGPVINGMNKSVHILQMGSSVQEIINMVMVAVIDAQCIQKREANA